MVKIKRKNRCNKRFGKKLELRIKRKLKISQKKEECDKNHSFFKNLMVE